LRNTRSTSKRPAAKISKSKKRNALEGMYGGGKFLTTQIGPFLHRPEKKNATFGHNKKKISV